MTLDKFSSQPATGIPSIHLEKAEDVTELDEDKSSVIQPGATVTNPAQDLLGELIFGRPSATGGYATVYEGSWTSPAGVTIAVAIKKLVPLHMEKLKSDHDAQAKRNLTRLRRETTIWLQISHRNILPLIGFREEDFCLVSQWCRNGSLEQYIVKHPTLSTKKRLSFLLQAAEGLKYLHGLKPPICHADVKPSNILIRDDLDDSDLEAALIDFGLSKVIDTLGEHNLYATSGVGQGGLGYQSMETLMGEPHSLKSDVFGFGGVILMVLSGAHPFFAYKIPTPIILRMTKDQLPTPEEHPRLAADDEMWGLIKRCWASEPSQRPSMDDVIVELEAERAKAP